MAVSWRNSWPILLLVRPRADHTRITNSRHWLEPEGAPAMTSGWRDVGRSALVGHLHLRKPNGVSQMGVAVGSESTRR